MIGISSCGWGPDFEGNVEMRGMDDPPGIVRLLFRYLHKGHFTEAEKNTFRELHRQYVIYCRRNDLTPVPLPKSLGKIP